LRSIGRRELRRRKARYAMTALGIVLGVANVFGVLVTNASTNRAIRNQSEVFTISQVFADPRGNSFDAVTLDRLRALPDVRSVSIFGEGTLRRVAHRKQPLYFSSIDAVGARIYNKEGLRHGRWNRTGAAEAVVTQAAIDDLHLKIGGELSLRMRTPSGVRSLPFLITGVLREAGDNYGGEVSLEYLWRVRGERTVAEVGFTLRHGVDPATWVAQRRTQFANVDFKTTAYPADFQRFISILQGAMSGAAAIAVFVGAFLIYLTFSMAVVERTRMYGTLHAVGSTSGQIARAVLFEALLLGSLASVAGLVFGTGLSFGLLRLVARAAQIPAAGLTVPPAAAAVGVLVGVGATVVGSLVPALRAARVSPVEAIRGTLRTVARPSRAWIAGAVLVVAALGLSLGLRGIQAPNVVSQVATLMILFGSVLLVPPLLGVLVRAGRRLIHRLTGGLGDVAVMHLVRERSRSAYPVGLVMVVLAMMLALAATSGSVGRSVTTWVDKRFGADLLAYDAGVTARAERAAAGVNGVSAVTAVTFGQTQIAQRNGRRLAQNLVLIEPERFFAVAGFPWAAGSDDAAARALSSGGNVLLPGTLAQQLSVDRGGEVALVTRDGTQPFRVASVYASIGAGNEVGVVAGVADARRFYVADTANVLYMNLDPSASKHRIVTDLDRVLAATGARTISDTPVKGPYGTKLKSNYFFIPGAEIKAQARRNVRSYFLLFYAVLFVAVIVGLLGLANTVTTSVIQRFREFGLLGAVGAAPDELRRMVIAEAAMLVGVAFVLSLALGTVLAHLIVDGVTKLVGFRIAFVFPWTWIPILAIGSVLIAMAASVLPARRAAALTPVEALRYE
jgi:putative ABC transport system permease protein